MAATPRCCVGAPGALQPLPAPRAVRVGRWAQRRAARHGPARAAASRSGDPPGAASSGGSQGLLQALGGSAALELANNLGQLAAAVEQGVTRLQRQLEPPPPNFPPGPPGDAALPLLQQPLQHLGELQAAHGDMVGLLLGGERVVLVADPAAARQVLIEQPQTFVKAGTAFFPGSSLAGNGLLVSDGEVWRRQRQLSNPAFRRSVVAQYAACMGQGVRRMLAERWVDGTARNVYADYNELTLGITLEALFGASMGEEESKEITDSIRTAFEFFARRAATAFIIPEFVPTPDNVQFGAAVARLDRAVYAIIAQRRRQLAQRAQHAQQQEQPAGGGGLLEGLLLARDESGEGMTDVALRDELMTLLVAGQETSAILLGWTSALLAHHPSAQQRAAAEAAEVLGGRGGSNGGSSGGSSSSQGAARSPLTAELAGCLPYMEAVVLEALRLLPPAYLVGRCACEPATLAGYSLPAGTTLLVSPYLLHRDPRWWGPDAGCFRPERWLDFHQQQPAAATAAAAGGGDSATSTVSRSSGSSSSSSSSNAAGTSSSSGGGGSGSGGKGGGGGMAFLSNMGPTGAFIPFGAGQRNCIGTGFAMLEAVLGMAAILQEYELWPLPGDTFPEPEPRVTLRPQSVRLLVRRR